MIKIRLNKPPTRIEERILAISDHLERNNEYNYINNVTRKNKYVLSFLERGEIFESYSQTKGKKFEIKIYAKYDLSKKVKLEVTDSSRDLLSLHRVWN